MKPRTVAFFLFIGGAAIFATTYSITYYLLGKWAKPVRFNVEGQSPVLAPNIVQQLKDIEAERQRGATVYQRNRTPRSAP